MELFWPSTVSMPVDERKSDRDEYKHNKAELAVWLPLADAHWGAGPLGGGKL